MKKILLIVLLFPIINAFGQKVEISLRAGTNYSSLNFATKGESSGGTHGSFFDINLESAKPEVKFGFNFSSQLVVPISNLISFETGIGMSLKRIDLVYDHSLKSSYRFINLELPILLKLNFLDKKLKLKGGAELNRIIDFTWNEKSQKDELETYYIGMLVGIEFKLLRNLSIDLCFDRNFSLIEKIGTMYQTAGIGIEEVKLNSFSLGLLYNF